MQNQLLKIIDLDFVSIEVYPNFLITTIKEGVVFDTNELETHIPGVRKSISKQRLWINCKQSA